MRTTALSPVSSFKKPQLSPGAIAQNLILYARPIAHALPLLLLGGDIEQNPGPWKTEDYCFLPSHLEQTLRYFNLHLPRIDLFASPEHHLVHRYYSLRNSAFPFTWDPSLGLLWANPPFSLLHQVVRKSIADRSFILILHPDWKQTSLTLLQSHSIGHLRFHGIPMFHRNGFIFPPPTWDILVFLLSPLPTTLLGWRKCLPNDGDVERNPGPDSSVSSTHENPFVQFVNFYSETFLGVLDSVTLGRSLVQVTVFIKNREGSLERFRAWVEGCFEISDELLLKIIAGYTCYASGSLTYDATGNFLWNIPRLLNLHRLRVCDSK